MLLGGRTRKLKVNTGIIYVMNSGLPTRTNYLMVAGRIVSFNDIDILVADHSRREHTH